MADNIELPSGSGGSIVATDDDGTAHHQYVKLEFGADNTQTKVSSANPLPVIAASNSGVDIGDVTINNATGASSIPVQGAAAADAAAAGNPLLAGGRASAADPTDMSADGDAVPLWTTLKGALNVADGGGSLTVDNAGLTELAAAINASSQVDVNIAASAATVTVDLGANNDVTVTNATAANLKAEVVGTGTFAVQVDGSALTALQKIDDPVYVDDAAFTPATSSVMMIGAEFDDTLPDSVDEGDAGALRMSANRNLFVTLRDAAGNERGLNVDANGAIAITDGAGTITVDNAGLTELAAAINASSQMDVNIAASNATVTVDLGVNNDVTVTGTVDLGATDNAVLDAIAASVAAIDADATTIIGHVDGIEALLGTMDADTGNIATAVQLLDDAVYVDDADWTDSTSKHLLVGGLYQSTPQTVTDGDVAPFNITSTGALHVAQQGTVTVDLGVNNDVTVTGTVDLGATDNAVLDAIAASLALLDNAIPSGNELQVDVVGALPAGTNAIGKLAANSGVDIGDVDILSIAAGTNSIGNVGLVGRATGGLSIHKSIDIDETEEEVKATAGTLYSILAFNRTAAPLYLKFYNLTAANTTVGTSTPVITIPVPANADSDVGGFTHSVAQGYAFDTAISVACTTGVADNDSGAPGANDCVILLGFL